MALPAVQALAPTLTLCVQARGVGLTPNGLAVEVNDPTIAVIEPEAIVCRRQRAEFDHGLIVFYQKMLHYELHALRQEMYGRSAPGPGAAAQPRFPATQVGEPA